MLTLKTKHANCSKGEGVVIETPPFILALETWHQKQALIRGPMLQRGYLAPGATSFGLNKLKNDQQVIAPTKRSCLCSIFCMEMKNESSAPSQY